MTQPRTTAGTDPESIRQELSERTLALCKIPSETGQEALISEWVEGQCSAFAGPESVKRIGNSLVCDPLGAQGAPGLPVVALVGHLDTVKCAEDQAHEIRDGRVYGCGATDMKAGIAVMLALLERWNELEGSRPVWIFYDGEEGPSEGNGLEAVLTWPELPAIDFAFILEPTDRALQPGCMGVLHASVTVPGVRAHSARPWQGENAIYRAIPLLDKFAKFERRCITFGALDFYEVIVVTQASTANSKNVVPDALVLNVNFRFAPGNTAENAERELREIVGGAATVELIDAAPSGEVHADDPLIREWRDKLALDIQPKQAWTDVARFTAHGIPAVNFGPGETSQAHQANEWCSIGSLEHCFSALYRFFRP